MALSFSVVINTLNRAAHLRTALQALRYQRYRNFEVVVVNGPSTDDTEAVAGEFPGVRLGRCPAANLSMSRNIGIAMSAGDVVAFMDDDAVPELDWLADMARAFADAKVGGAGGAIRDHTGVGFQARVIVCDRFGWAEGFDSIDAAKPDGPGRPLRYYSPTGANVAYRRSALLGIGGFDERIVYFLDETDVNLRLLEAGWAIRYRAGAEVHHKYAPSAQRTAARAPRSLHHPARSAAYFCRRHAVSAHGAAAAQDHVRRYQAHLRRDVAGHARSGAITQELQKALLAEIDAGAAEGWALAAEGPLLMGSGASKGGGFQPFPTFEQRARLRVAMVSAEYPPAQTGGVGVWTQAVAEGLAARGHEVSVVARAQADNASVDFLNGVWLHRVPDVDPSLYAPGVDLPDAMRARAEAVYDEVSRIRLLRGLDLVSAPIWDLEGAVVAARADVATLLSLHTTYALTAPFKPDWRADRQIFESVAAPMMRAERAALKRAPFILANSEGVLAALEGWAPDLDIRARSSVIAHGLPDRAGAMRVKSQSGELRLLFVGRLEARKGVDVLLQALPEVLAGRPHLRVDIVGREIGEAGATHAESFRARHADAPWCGQVRFHGELSPDALDDAYRAADIFVAPSRFESFGLVFVEAMMFGVASVGSDVGGVAEVLGREGESGLLVPPGDAPALAAALNALIDDPRRRRAMAASARARYEAHFSAGPMISALEALMRKAIAARIRAV